MLKNILNFIRDLFIISLIVFLWSIGTTRAYFAASLAIKNNTVSIGYWEIPTPTPTPCHQCGLGIPTPPPVPTLPKTPTLPDLPHITSDTKATTTSSIFSSE